MKPDLIFLLDSNKNVSYDILNELDKYKKEPFSVFIGCTSDFGIETFRLAKKTSEVLPKEKIYLFPGKLTQAFSSVFCNKVLAPEIMNGKNRKKYNYHSNLGEKLLNHLGKETEHFKYVVMGPGSKVAKKLGISKELSNTQVYLIADSIAFDNHRKPDFVYFEAGSGAKKSINQWKLGINEAYKRLNRKKIRVNIGGGINSPQDLEGILADGAVISSAIEKDLELIAKFIKYSKE